MEGGEDVVWRERGQVFSVLTKLGSSCQLVRPPDDIKRRSVTKISNVFQSENKHVELAVKQWKDKLNHTFSCATFCLNI